MYATLQMRVANIAVRALRNVYGTYYRAGTSSNIICKSTKFCFHYMLERDNVFPLKNAVALITKSNVWMWCLIEAAFIRGGVYQWAAFFRGRRPLEELQYPRT